MHPVLDLFFIRPLSLNLLGSSQRSQKTSAEESENQPDWSLGETSCRRRMHAATLLHFQTQPEWAWAMTDCLLVKTVWSAHSCPLTLWRWHHGPACRPPVCSGEEHREPNRSDKQPTAAMHLKKHRWTAEYVRRRYVRRRHHFFHRERSTVLLQCAVASCQVDPSEVQQQARLNRKVELESSEGHTFDS